MSVPQTDTEPVRLIDGETLAASQTHYSPVLDVRGYDAVTLMWQLNSTTGIATQMRVWWSAEAPIAGGTLGTTPATHPELWALWEPEGDPDLIFPVASLPNDAKAANGNDIYELGWPSICVQITTGGSPLTDFSLLAFRTKRYG